MYFKLTVKSFLLAQTFNISFFDSYVFYAENLFNRYIRSKYGRFIYSGNFANVPFVSLYVPPRYPNLSTGRIQIPEISPFRRIRRLLMKILVKNLLSKIITIS